MYSQNDLLIKNLFDLDHSLAKPYLASLQYPWEALPLISSWIVEIGKTLPTADYEEVQENVWLSKKAKIAPSATLNGPLIVGHDTEIRHCAFIRGNVLIGDTCVVGNSTELKNVILMDSVQVPHFNYIGDSILGYKAHLGAGAITSNIKADRTRVKVKLGQTYVNTNLVKFGAMIGDNVEIGCNSVLNPGAVIGPNSHIYPVTMVRGFVPANSIYKNNGSIVEKY